MENCIQIGKGDLKIWVGKPGERYSRPRFDWTGFITQVSLCGHTFCTPEEGSWRPQGSGGEGLCGEFRMDVGSMGWDETDKLFLKPGVGLLERSDDQPYNFGVDYKIVKAFPCTVREGDDFVDFHLDAIPLKGISYTLDKHVSIIDNMVLIGTSVTNTGDKLVTFDEYNHNFLSMDGFGAHSKVNLSLHKDYFNSIETPGLIMNEDGISFTDDLQSPFMIFCRSPIAYSPLRWELRDEKAGMYVQEWGDFDVSQFLAWGGPHVIAPEIYGSFPVAPGQTRTWIRLWKFYIF